MITASIWLAWFSAFGMFSMDQRWSNGERAFLFCLYVVAPILATIAVNG